MAQIDKVIDLVIFWGASVRTADIWMRQIGEREESKKMPGVPLLLVCLLFV